MADEKENLLKGSNDDIVSINFWIITHFFLYGEIHVCLTLWFQSF